jgi:hypothetical protein
MNIIMLQKSNSIFGSTGIVVGIFKWWPNSPLLRGEM